MQENGNNDTDDNPVGEQQGYQQQPADAQNGYQPRPPNTSAGYAGQGYYYPQQGKNPQQGNVNPQGYNQQGYNPQGNAQQYNPYAYNSPGVRDYLNSYDPKGKAVAGFILGLTSFIGMLIPIFGLASSIVGIVLSAKGNHSSQHRMAVAGTVISIIGLIASVIAWFLYTMSSANLL